MPRTFTFSNLKAKKPQFVLSFGYALFLAIGATVLWGGVFPFMPLDLQTDEMIDGFFLAQSLIFACCYFLSSLGSYLFPHPVKRFLVWAAGIPYFLGWCCFVASIYLTSFTLPLIYTGGGLIGFGSAGFFMIWQRLFAAQKADIGNRSLIVGTLVAPITYFALCLIPTAVVNLLIPFVFTPVFCLCIVLSTRCINLDQPMFNDVPREHPQAYRLVLSDYWRSAVSFGALAFSCGAIKSFALETPRIGNIINNVSMITLFVGAGLLLYVWQYKALRININQLFRIFFPIILTAFLLLPLLGQFYLKSLAGALHALYSCTVVVIMIQCAQASRDRGVNPIFIYGFVAGILYALHDIGYIVGSFVSALSSTKYDPSLSVAFASIYILGMMFFLIQGGFKAASSTSLVNAERVELIATAGNSFRLRKSSGTFATLKDVEAKKKAHYQDKLSKQCSLVQSHFKLTEREEEVIELIARGNTAAGIAYELALSENTIRTHMKHIYAKLDIHKKQELIELINTFDPKALTNNKSFQ